MAGQFLAGCCQLPMAPLGILCLLPQPGVQQPWVQLLSLTLFQALAVGPGADPLRCSKAVASLALCPSGCLGVQALTSWKVLGKDIFLMGK